MNLLLENENIDTPYRKAEERAANYLHSLMTQISQKNYITTLTCDFQSWKQDHIEPTLFSRFALKKQQPSSKDYHNYLKWLDQTGKLENYLDRSISYIFMRDLGKALDTPDTQKRVKHVVTDLKSTLLKKDKNDPLDVFSISKLYRTAQKEGYETTLIWLIHKLKIVSDNIPDGMDAEHSKRKLIKIIAGVYMHEFEDMRGKDLPQTERTKRLERAIRLGYSYGLTYPFIDDLLDANILSEQEANQYSDLIRTTLTTGSVPDLGEWRGKHEKLIRFVHSELKEAFEYIKANQSDDMIDTFFEQSYVFFKSQEVDRKKDLSIPTYTNEEIYIPVIIKSASSRLIVRNVLSAQIDEGFDIRTFYYGIYNQLADDFADMFNDLKDGAVTPYTYYLMYHKTRKDLINPFELYWTVIAYLIHNVYHSDTKTREVILNRAINGLKRYKEKMGSKKYNEVMDIFSTGKAQFDQLIQKIVKKAKNVEFLDKLIRDQMIDNLRNDQTEQENFQDMVETAREQINLILPIQQEFLVSESIIEAAKISLESGGKRLRPVMTWVLANHEYGLEVSAITPLLKSLEYMHTASLIFDDLPSQDNAKTRRGKPTLHQVYSIAIAELTGLYLTQKAIEEQTNLNLFHSDLVLKLVQYSAKVTADMCMGQALDIEAKGKPLTLKELNTMCFYKTGLAFEASLIMPAILANRNQNELDSLKTFAYHAGIAFQIKDDLLDVEGDQQVVGKTIGIDAKNNNSTFVSILGIDGAKKAMWDHYCSAIESVQHLPQKTNFLKHLMNYIVHREN